MRGRMVRVLGLALALAVIAGIAPANGAHAETQTENIVAEQRTSLSLRIANEAAQALLPAGWTVAAGPDAPNISLIFMDRKLALTPDGKPLLAGHNRVLVISVPAKNAQTGQSSGLIVGGYSTDPGGVPGAYKVYGAGSVDLTRSERVEGMKTNIVEERWTVKAADGGVLNVNLSFERGVPTFRPFESKVYSGADPSFYRIYRGEQATDTLRSASGSVDRVKSVTVQASGGRLGKLLGGGGPVISVSNSPFYARRTFLP